MEALRAAGRAVLRSPRLARRGLGLRRRRLPERWDVQEPLLEGLGFALKYLGMTLVDTPKGEDMAAAAIRRILATARVGAQKLRKVILTVSPRGISLQDAETQETIENISIYRISYCTTDKLQNKVFAYVAQSQQSGALECHAFLSPKKKIAQAVTLTVAQAFQVALDLWEAARAGSRQEQPLRPSCALESSEPGSTRAPAPMGNTPLQHLGEEEEEDDDLDEAFPRLDTASAGSRDLVRHTAGNELAPPGAPPGRQGQAGGGCQSPCTRAILPCGALGLTRPRQASAPPSRTKCSHPPCA
ncbi:low density lipoprotein receptor adapter protein 1 isoform X2 [Alligator mississippiensis]|uniref:low density lipoprotein receptor adapter protein 1 isoform X2 n=1 Tax=Alligator mississippiensis TaxID=8496 RepID=UPI002877EC82|nr:low density lipoprotein receptor adapter protein 1 isoform X2 [Alligator mississippiensis]